MRGIREMENKKMAKYIDIEQYINNLRELQVGDKDTTYEYYDDGIDVAISEAARFPTVDIPRWIPVTDRLPKLYTNVLLSVRQSYAFGEPDNWSVVGQLIDKADITWATNYGFHDTLYSNGKHTVWVSAWMPLPEPYKGGEER